MPNETIEAIGNDGQGLRLEFRWLGDRYHHPSRAELIFDFACRHSDRPLYLGNQYRLFAAAENAFAIRGLDSEIQQYSDTLQIQPRLTPAAAQTTRWKYAVSVNRT
jgi:hypothetical protein